MAPKKKKSSMVWVVKSQQSAKMAEPETEKKTSSMTLDCSILADSVSKLQLSPSPSAKMAQPATKEHTLSMPGWSQLPEELLHIILMYLDNCFDVVHARSVCRPWRSTFPFPSCLLRTSYSLPSFAKFRRKGKNSCTLEKVPLFLFVRAPTAAASPSEYFLGDIGRRNSEDLIEIPSPLQCSVKVKIPGSDPILLNMLDCQIIIPLGYQYRMIGYDPQSLSSSYRAVAFLPLNKEGRGEFIVLISYSNNLFALRSDEMRWKRLEEISSATCTDLVTFRGRFYAVFLNSEMFLIDPYSLEATTLMPPLELVNSGSQNYLVPSGNDELFLVEVIIPRYTGVINFSRLACRVSRLDEEAGKWVEVSDLGDRVLFIGEHGNCSCSAKELSDGCGVSGNSVLFTNDIWDEIYAYKYGVETGNAEDDLNFWRFSRENHVAILNKSPPVVALRILGT